MTDSQVVACKALTDIKGIGADHARTLLVRMGRPNVFVSGDGLVRKWMQKCYGIDPNKETAETERARIDKASEWAPYRSVIYLLIAYAKDPITIGVHPGLRAREVRKCRVACFVKMNMHAQPKRQKAKAPRHSSSNHHSHSPTPLYLVVPATASFSFP